MTSQPVEINLASLASGEIVEDCNLRPQIQKMLGIVASHKSGPTSDQGLQKRSDAPENDLRLIGLSTATLSDNKDISEIELLDICRRNALLALCRIREDSMGTEVEKRFE